jgi:hypothetical protein
MKQAGLCGLTGAHLVRSDITLPERTLTASIFPLMLSCGSNMYVMYMTLFKLPDMLIIVCFTCRCVVASAWSLHQTYHRKQGLSANGMNNFKPSM